MIVAPFFFGSHRACRLGALRQGGEYVLLVDGFTRLTNESL